MKRFFREALRVLKPGGWFLFADARPQAKMLELEKALSEIQGWELIETENLTQYVFAALASDDTQKRKRIGDVFATGDRALIEEFAAVSGTSMYRRFQDGTFLYKRWSYRKL